MKRLLLTICFILSLSLSLVCCVKATHVEAPESSFVSHLNNSTVALVRKDFTGEYSTSCSGFWISEYHIVTARHCVDNEAGGAPKGTIVNYTTYKEFSGEIPPKPPEKVYTAVVVASRARSDLAILKTVDDIEHGYLKIAVGPVKVGTEVHNVSHPSDLDYSYIKGIVAQTRQFDFRAFGSNKNVKILHITSLVNRGSSGSAFVDGGGHVVGICSSLLRTTPGATFFIHKDELLSLAEANNISHY